MSTFFVSTALLSTSRCHVRVALTESTLMDPRSYGAPAPQPGHGIQLTVTSEQGNGEAVHGSIGACISAICSHRGGLSTNWRHAWEALAFGPLIRRPPRRAGNLCGSQTAYYRQYLE